MSGRILVFIPAYNCAPQIVRVLDQIRRPGVAELIDGVVCVDNRSTDTTLEAAAEAMKTLPLSQLVLLHNDDNYGLGGSHKVAIEFARREGYEFLIVLHGDDQGDINDILPHLQAGCHLELDFLMGARFMAESRLEGYSTLRTLANRAFNLIFSLFSGSQLHDLGSGLNLFRVAAFDDDFHLSFADDLTFNYYLILGIARRKMRLAFFPLTWREDDQISNAKLSRMGIQLMRIVAFRFFAPRVFFTADHRKIPWEAYPSTRII